MWMRRPGRSGRARGRGGRAGRGGASWRMWWSGRGRRRRRRARRRRHGGRRGGAGGRGARRGGGGRAAGGRGGCRRRREVEAPERGHGREVAGVVHHLGGEEDDLPPETHVAHRERCARVVVAPQRRRYRGGRGRGVELRLGGDRGRRGEPEIELRGGAAVEVVARDAGGGDGDRVRGQVRAARDDVPRGEARGRHRVLAREVVVPVVDLRVVGPVAAVEIGRRRRVAHRGRRVPEEVVPLARRPGDVEAAVVVEVAGGRRARVPAAGQLRPPRGLAAGEVEDRKR